MELSWPAGRPGPAGALAAGVLDLYRELHQHPELGWCEFWTAARLVRQLSSLGYAVSYGRSLLGDAPRPGLPADETLRQAEARAVGWGCPSELVAEMSGGFTAVVAELDSGVPGPVTAVRSDLDALPITEGPHAQPRSAAEGIMHACGHDGHVAIAVGVASAVRSAIHRLRGRVRFIFQPAEEGCRGAAALLDTPALAGVDHLIGYHLGLGLRETGSVCPAVSGFLATTKLRVEFEGKSAHAGNAPEHGRNALLAAATAALTIHTLSQHGQSLTRINVGRMEGGEATNIVPAHASMLVETRADRNDVNELLVERLMNVVAGTATAYGVRFGVETIGQARAITCDPSLAAVVTRAAAGRGLRVVEGVPFGASEDFTLLAERVQRAGGAATYVLIGSSYRGNHHQPDFALDPESLLIGVDLLTDTILQLNAAGRPASPAIP